MRGSGFVVAGLLAAGDSLTASDGSDTEILGVSVEYVPGAVRVYNLKVEDFHTYRVGAGGVLVHNSDCGMSQQELGAAREKKVAELTEGRVSHEKIKNGSGGSDIDVITKSGDLVTVGGPAKAKNLRHFQQVCQLYKDEAKQRGVKALGYFSSDTPRSVLLVAKKVLGKNNVFTFDP